MVHVVDLAARTVRHTIALEPGDEPGRVAIGGSGAAHVVLRGWGGVATIDLVAGTVVERRWLCPEPRGIVFDAAASSLHVACADGLLVHMPETGAPTLTQVLEPDLRDVVLVDGDVKVSVFREAALRGDGTRVTPPDADVFVPHVAWATRVDPQGRVFMLHQLTSTNPVPINPVVDQFTAQESLPYGGGPGDFCVPGITNTAITVFENGEPNFTTLIPDAALSVDFAVSPDGERIALAVPGAAEGEGTAQVMGLFDGGCFETEELAGDAQVTAVAYDPGGVLVMQSREPARILIQPYPLASLEVIELPGESRFDTGHEIFHRATEAGLSCASCHPEGGDDGHVWVFQGLGARRTQALDVGLEGTAPFHWDGDMDDLDMIMEEVLSHRMGGKQQSPARSDSFARWLFAQERPAANTGREDVQLVAEGASLFTTYDCGRCHLGPKLGGATSEPVRGKELQVPTLRRVSLRPPFMHDGRSRTLEDAVRDMIESTTQVPVEEQNVAALVAYMRTL